MVRGIAVLSIASILVIGEVMSWLNTASQILGIGSAAKDLFGGGNESSWDNQKGAMFFQADLQREFAKHGVRWRVEDAAAAGLHPLAALGMQPVQGGGIPVMAEPSSRGRSHSEAAATMAALASAEAQVDKDRAMADYYRSIAEKARREPSVKEFPEQTVKINPVDPIRHVDWVKLEADPVMASSSVFPGTTAGIDHPGMRQFTFPGGFKALLPATQGGGVPEEIDVSMLPIVIGANVNRYGAKWPLDLLEYMVTGGRPEELSEGGKKLRRLFRQ